MAAHAAEPDAVVPPMPERTPKALRQAIAERRTRISGGSTPMAISQRACASSQRTRLHGLRRCSRRPRQLLHSSGMWMPESSVRDTARGASPAGDLRRRFRWRSWRAR
jgi:hypothetical protein